MKRYRLSYLPLFDEDLAEAWNYIAKKLRNPEAANKLIADVEAAILKRLDTRLISQKKKENTPTIAFMSNTSSFFML